MVSGPGGVGKGTIVGALLDRHPQIWLSRSWTTRARRPGESEDAYVFTDRASFDAHIDAGGFLEWVDFLDYRQGTPVPDAPAGHDVLFEIDVEGARAVSAVDPEALLVFVDSPTPEDQRARLVERGDAPERVEARMRKGEEERRVAVGLDMHHIVNRVVDDAVAELERLIRTHRVPGAPASTANVVSSANPSEDR
ncbi:MAG: guanylate kinase [Acidimicrobiales bacterium]